jgi:hypothetical protein
VAVTREELDGAPLTGEQWRLVRETWRAGLQVRHALTPAESETLDAELDRFDGLSSTEQRAELERPDSPWRGYVWEYDGFGLTILGRVAPVRAQAPREPAAVILRARPRARAGRPRRRRRASGSRDRPRLADDDEADLDPRRRREAVA